MQDAIPGESKEVKRKRNFWKGRGKNNDGRMADLAAFGEKEVKKMRRFTIPRIAHCNEGHADGPGQDRKLSPMSFDFS